MAAQMFSCAANMCEMIILYSHLYQISKQDYIYKYCHTWVHCCSGKHTVYHEWAVRYLNCFATSSISFVHSQYANWSHAQTLAHVKKGVWCSEWLLMSHGVGSLSTLRGQIRLQTKWAWWNNSFFCIFVCLLWINLYFIAHSWLFQEHQKKAWILDLKCNLFWYSLLSRPCTM